MDYKSEIKPVKMEDFLAEVIRLKMGQWRLAQICAVRVQEGYELSYSFCSRAYEMITLRLLAGLDDVVHSITQIYPCAFLQENEAAELFGVHIESLNPDYHSKIYRINKETPFKEKG